MRQGLGAEVRPRATGSIERGFRRLAVAAGGVFGLWYTWNTVADIEARTVIFGSVTGTLTFAVLLVLCVLVPWAIVRGVGWVASGFMAR